MTRTSNRTAGSEGARTKQFLLAYYFRGLSAAVIVLLVAACGVAIYANHLSSIRASDREALEMRASLVRSYLDVLSREIHHAADDIGNWYASTPPPDGALEPSFAGDFGTLIGMDDVAGPSVDLGRELESFVQLEDRFRFLTHSASDFGRTYYRSRHGPIYVAPAIPRSFEHAFLDFAKGASDSRTQTRWLLRRADMFNLGDVQTTLWVAAPVRMTGGVLFVRIKSEKIRPMLRQGDSVSDFYLANGSDSVRLWDNRAKRFRENHPSDEPWTNFAPDSPYSHVVGNGLRVVQRYPQGEPYASAARASLVPWLILTVAASMTGWLVHRALRTEIAERRRVETDVRKSYEEQQKLSTRLRNLANELTEVQRRERKRLAALLHDDLQQTLVATRMKLGQAKRQGYDLADADHMLCEAIETSRDLSRQVRPPALYEAGLIPALRWLAKQTQQRYALEVSIDATEDDAWRRLSDEVSELLFEAVRELVFNIVKHADASRAHIELRASRERLRISVRDWGRGFERSEHSSSESFGLFSVEERLLAIDGDMSIRSAVGQGTAVRISVPVHYGLQSVEVMPTDPPNIAVELLANRSQTNVETETGHRVLVVDDHAVVRQSIASVLQSEPHLAVVGEASNGAEAIDAVEHCRPEVILMDVDLPDMSGIEATERILELWPNIVIIGLSVHDEVAVAEPLREAGAAGLLSKSNGLEAVVARVLSEAERSRDRPESKVCS